MKEFLFLIRLAVFSPAAPAYMNYRNFSVFSAVLTDWWERLSAAIEMIKFHFYRGWKAAPSA
ncbi:MAG: hypothetical protein PVG74_25705, partial [Desulfobacterales bacterium]